MLSNPTAHLLWALLAVNIIKGLALFLTACVFTRLVKNIPSEYKHLIWFLVLISFIVMPVMWFVLPEIQGEVQLSSGISEGWRLTAAPFISRDQYMDHVSKAYNFTVFPRETKAAIITNVLLILGAVWVIGLLFYFGRYITATVALKRIRQSAETVDECRPLLQELSRKVKTGKKITLLSSNKCGIPFTYGMIKPTIILPDTAPGWSDTRLRSVLLHELAHIKRKDFLYNTITSIICSLFWFLPITWIAHSFMLREEEKCCDLYVLNRGIPGADYASDIVEVAQSSDGRLLLPCAYTGIGKKGILKDRIKHILEIRPGRFSVVFKRIGLILIILFCCILPLLAMTYTTKPYVPGRDEVLYGYWESKHDSHQKCWDTIVYVHNGQSLTYMSSRSEPLFEDRYVITDKWIDMDGNTCYKLTVNGNFYPYDETQAVNQWYKIIRINPEGNTLEIVCSQTDYPKEFSTVGGGCYWIYYRH